MSAAYVRDRYQVPAKRGMRVVVDGRPGVIVSFPGAYLGVRFDGEKRTRRCHPWWRVSYLPDPCDNGPNLIPASASGNADFPAPPPLTSTHVPDLH